MTKNTTIVRYDTDDKHSLRIANAPPNKKILCANKQCTEQVKTKNAHLGKAKEGYTDIPAVYCSKQCELAENL